MMAPSPSIQPPNKSVEPLRFAHRLPHAHYQPTEGMIAGVRINHLAAILASLLAILSSRHAEYPRSTVGVNADCPR